MVWNYRLHEQYILEENYFSELLHVSRVNKCQDEIICKELVEAGLINASLLEKDEWGWDVLSKIFHVGTQNVGEKNSALDAEQFSREYIDCCADLKNNIPSIFLEREGNLIDLPKPDISMFEEVSFFSAIKNRKTCRAFNSESIKLEELGSILFCSFGLIHGEWDELREHNLEQVGVRKSSPSSGGAHAEEAYIVVYRVEGLDPGLYHYRPHDHKLTQMKSGDFEKKTIEMNYKQFFSEGMAFGVYLTSRLEKTWWKYKHSRAYRGTLLDIGHVSQVFLNCVSALGLQTWLTGAFHDAEVEDFLAIAGDKEIPLLFVGAGKGKNQTIPDVMINKLKE